MDGKQYGIMLNHKDNDDLKFYNDVINDRPMVEDKLDENITGCFFYSSNKNNKDYNNIADSSNSLSIQHKTCRNTIISNNRIKTSALIINVVDSINVETTNNILLDSTAGISVKESMDVLIEGNHFEKSVPLIGTSITNSFMVNIIDNYYNGN